MVISDWYVVHLLTFPVPPLIDTLTTFPCLQVLIFVHSRKETAKTARYIKDTAITNEAMAKFLREDSASREILQVGREM